MKNNKILYCNKCGKQLRTEQGQIREGAVRVQKEWDYFSKKDGELHCFCLCEACYDKLREDFVIPAQIRQVREYL